jgi:serine/threonine protein kinase
MSTDFDKLREVFQVAVEQHAASQWDAYLDQACAGDMELRHKVALLLKAHAEGGSLVDQATPDMERTRLYQPIAEGPGTVIGPYKLMEQIGEGGMGLVFVAEQQQPVRRKVALKVIKPGMDSRQVIARFEAERQALAMMDHPHIAKVYDGGATAEGRPYFAMEFVRGTPITEYCDRHRLSNRERLQLFLDVCHAVQHAHQKGIIHRDLKPSNVLVEVHDVQPVVKVIDFGIAKATGQKLTDRTVYTAVAQMVGTPLYMSPEQAGLSSLDVDTRSDVYSLGVLLYELLTGTTPFDRETFNKASYDEMRRIIREDEPPRPSGRLSTMERAALSTIAEKRGLEPGRLSQHLRGELDWIVMKALEKDRNRRYETANGIARDIERYLADEPVEACPPSAGYKLRKFARKNRQILATAGTFMLLLMAAAVVSTWQAFRATQAETKARQALTLAEERFDLAKEAVDKYLNEVTETPELKGANLEALRKKLLESALPFYQKLAEQAPGDPEREAARGRAYGRLGDIRLDLGEAEAALADFREMHDIFAPLAEAFPAEPDYRRDESRSLFGQAEALGGPSRSNIGRPADAEAAYRAALAVGQQLVNDFPSIPDYRSDLAKSHNRLASLLGSILWKHVEAVAEVHVALKEQQRLVDEHPNVLDYRHELARSHNHLGSFLRYQGKEAESVAEYRIALKQQQRLADECPNVPLYHHFLGCTQRDLGEYRAALKEFERLVAKHPSVFEYSFWLALTHKEFGDQLAKEGKHADAEKEYRAALKNYQRLADELAGDRWPLAENHRALGLLVGQQGKPAEAEAEYVKAEAEYRAALKEQWLLVGEHPDVSEYRKQLIQGLQKLGELLVGQGKQVEAEREYLEAIRVDPKNAAVIWNARGDFYYKRHEYAKQWFLVKPNILAMTSAFVFKVAD